MGCKIILLVDVHVCLFTKFTLFIIAKINAITFQVIIFSMTWGRASGKKHILSELRFR